MIMFYYKDYVTNDILPHTCHLKHLKSDRLYQTNDARYMSTVNKGGRGKDGQHSIPIKEYTENNLVCYDRPTTTSLTTRQTNRLTDQHTNQHIENPIRALKGLLQSH